MEPGSEERNAKENKYVVDVVPSSSPNRRFLVFILAAVAVVIMVVLLATLIPIYVIGNGGDESNGKSYYISHCIERRALRTHVLIFC